MILVCTEPILTCFDFDSKENDKAMKMALAAQCTAKALVKNGKITKEEWEETYREVKKKTDRSFDEKVAQRSWCEIF